MLRGRDTAFEARVERWRPDLVRCLGRVYGVAAADAVADRLVAIARAGHDARPADLRELDERRLRDPDWFQLPSMIGYAAYADRFAGTLAGVGERASYLRDLGVGYLHLMPLLTPRPAPNDGGYAVQDYRSVRPDLGTVDDLRTLTGTLRHHGISLCLDLVLNHVAREHAWAEAARAGDAEKRASSPTEPSRTPTRRPCPRSSPTSRRGTSAGTTISTAGSGRRSTTTSGTSTGRTRRCCASTPTSS
jgi:amylosucrase